MGKKRGFTLIELVVVVALLGVVMALGYNIWANMQRSYKEQEKIASAQSKARNAILLMVNKMKREDRQIVSGASSLPSIVINGSRLRIRLVGSEGIEYFSSGDRIISQKYNGLTEYPATITTLVRGVEDTSDGFKVSQSGGKIEISIKIKDADKPIEGEYVQRAGIEN
jgi:prepilin-type N-terminal cleavage/methylation domain-containing protein